MTTDWKRRSRSIRKERKNHKAQLRRENKELATDIVIIDDLTKEEARMRIIEYFEYDDTPIYPSELSEWLHIDYELTWAILKELQREGYIE